MLEPEFVEALQEAKLDHEVQKWLVAAHVYREFNRSNRYWQESDTCGIGYTDCPSFPAEAACDRQPCGIRPFGARSGSAWLRVSSD